MRHTLHYTDPAAEWQDALPVGNGRLGGMIYGRPSDELICLNEDSIWSGKYRNRNNPLAKRDLEKLRQLIREEREEEAEALAAASFFGTNDQQRHYMPLGDLHIYQDADGYECYSHTLSLSEAVDTVRFTAGGTAFERKTIASYPDQVIAVIFTSDRQGSISFTACIDGRDEQYDKNCSYDDDTLLFTASDGIAFSCAVTASSCGGTCRTEANRIVCKGADSAVLIIAAQTGYRTGDHENMALSQAKAAARKTPFLLLSRHITDHRRLFDRCTLDLYRHDCSLTTSQRIEAVANGGEDIGLAELYFDFSRYLMIAGSREGTLPLNLQGIWNRDMDPAWGSKYTVNINTEMNYWGAEMQNLSECHTPLFDHIERMREHGRVTAREMYGCSGSVCHHNTDIWGDTAPQDRWMPGTLWPMGMAWLCLHLWEHYCFTHDGAFLSEKYDTMREACEFFLDFLTEDSEGRLVTNPSLSPENTFIGKSGRQGRLCEGSAMDCELIYSLFSAVIAADEELGGADESFTARLREVRGRLPRLSVGKYGQICEWSYDYDEAEPGHRHISQLFALYPADMITPENTPELAKAAAATLERRLSFGGGHTGWSRAWIINMYARLRNGAKVAENINALLGRSTAKSMLDMHPPFQIDGNFGGGAGICEALFQSIGGVLHFLPALPPAWTRGRLTGIAARGAFTVSFDWEDSRPVYAKIVSHAGSVCRIRWSDSITVNGRTVYPEDGICSFETEKSVYKIIF